MSLIGIAQKKYFDWIPAINLEYGTYNIGYTHRYMKYMNVWYMIYEHIRMYDIWYMDAGIDIGYGVDIHYSLQWQYLPKKYKWKKGYKMNFTSTLLL